MSLNLFSIRAFFFKHPVVKLDELDELDELDKLVELDELGELD